MLYIGFMKRFFFLAACLLHTACCFSQLPDCDIWLLTIKDSGGKVSFSNPMNITDRKGYDNQPAFSPDGKYIFYTRYDDHAKQSDIFKYEIAAKKSTQFTKTPASEYSPTYIPDGKNISAVMVEKDSAQRLWKFPLAGGEPGCIMKNVDSIGYYCWINTDSVALHILTKPFTLQIAAVKNQKLIVAADSIGRCMKMKDGKLWFTTTSVAENNVYEYDLRSKKATLKGAIESEDFCFYKNEIWSCSGNGILSGFLNSKLGSMEIVNLGKFGITKITRIAVSPDGRKLAVVSNK